MPWTTQTSGNRSVSYQHSAIAANATNSTDALAVSGFRIITIHIRHANHADTSTFEVQSRMDGTNWEQISGTSITTVGAADSDTLVINPAVFEDVRVTITEADAAATSTLTVDLLGYK